MKWKSFCWFQIILLCIVTPSSPWARTYGGPKIPREETHSINIRYQSVRRLPSLQEKVGLTIGLAPANDTRHGRQYVGHYVYRGVSTHLRCEPFPLEKAIGDSLIQLLSLYGIKTVPIPNWDGKEESLKDTGVDSILMVDIRRFWAEGAVRGRGININTSIYLIFRLGAKKENRVFRRDMYTIKDDPVDGLTPAGVEQVINQTLDEILDTFFSDPY
jgi:hypothetical protein